MKKTLFLLLITTLSLKAQDKIGYQIDSKILEFEISRENYFIRFNKNNKKLVESGSLEFFEISENSAIIKVELSSQKDFQSNKTAIIDKFQYTLQNIEPVLVFKDGVKHVYNGEIILKLKKPARLDQLLVNLKFEAIADQFVTDQYIIKIENLSTHQIFTLVSELNNNDKVEFSEPNLIRFLKPHTDDPFLSSQWSLDNQGYFGGTVDADMDIKEAWTISTGQNVKVAIIDEGVDLTHTDLTPNLLQGYDATGNNSNGAPNESNNDGHGTSCAGIVAAVANNGVGIAGVAYNSKVIPVRIAYSNGYPLGDNRRSWVTSNSWIANGINWAVQNGADILSNSWGGGSPSSTITNAINNAINNGRNGKGALSYFHLVTITHL